MEIHGNLKSYEASLLNYQNNRIIRTARVQLQSREIGRHVYHPDGAHALLRNKIMKSKSQDEWHDNIEWLYGGTGLDH